MYKGAKPSAVDTLSKALPLSRMGISYLRSFPECKAATASNHSNLQFFATVFLFSEKNNGRPFFWPA